MQQKVVGLVGVAVPVGAPRSAGRSRASPCPSRAAGATTPEAPGPKVAPAGTDGSADVGGRGACSCADVGRRGACTRTDVGGSTGTLIATGATGTVTATGSRSSPANVVLGARAGGIRYIPRSDRTSIGFMCAQNMRAAKTAPPGILSSEMGTTSSTEISRHPVRDNHWLPPSIRVSTAWSFTAEATRREM
jgi:hypothetical protein